MPKFKNTDEYYQWCDSMITKIYYANIAMNNQAIKDAMAKINSVFHVTEGDSLIAQETETSTDEETS